MKQELASIWGGSGNIFNFELIKDCEGETIAEKEVV